MVEALGTRKVGEVRDGQMRFELAVRLDEPYRDDPRKVSRLLISAPGGERIPLARLTRMQVVEGPSSIQREWEKRRIIIQANARGRDVGSFVEAVREAIEADC